MMPKLSFMSLVVACLSLSACLEGPDRPRPSGKTQDEQYREYILQEDADFASWPRLKGLPAFTSESYVDSRNENLNEAYFGKAIEVRTLEELESNLSWPSSDRVKFVRLKLMAPIVLTKNIITNFDRVMIEGETLDFNRFRFDWRPYAQYGDINCNIYSWNRQRWVTGSSYGLLKFEKITLKDLEVTSVYDVSMVFRKTAFQGITRLDIENGQSRFVMRDVTVADGSELLVTKAERATLLVVETKSLDWNTKSRFTSAFQDFGLVGLINSELHYTWGYENFCMDAFSKAQMDHGRLNEGAPNCRLIAMSTAADLCRRRQ